MPEKSSKDKRLTLYPLKFDEVISDVLKVKPKPKLRRKAKQKAKSKQHPRSNHSPQKHLGLSKG